MPLMHHQQDKVLGGEGGAQGAAEDSNSDSSLDLDSDSSLERVIYMDLLSLLPPSSDWGEQTIIA